MTDQDLVTLLRAVDALDLKESEDHLTRAWASCLPLSRAQQLALDPSLWTEAERQHVAGCRLCNRLMEKLTRPNTELDMGVRLSPRIALNEAAAEEPRR